MKKQGTDRFQDIGYEAFRELARDPSLSKYEKIGFPDSYREGFEEAIFADIRAKLPRLDERERLVVDIGPGCSDLPHMIVALCREQGHTLVLLDSPEMLAGLPDGPGIRKQAGFFPTNAADLADLEGAVDALICYSVFHYLFKESDVFAFLDTSLALLAHGGAMLIGDIPNQSKRKRFFASPAGIAFHKAFMKTDEPPRVDFNTLEPGTIDDAVLFAMVQRARSAGFDAYLVPQSPGCPMANRREDLLIMRP